TKNSKSQIIVTKVSVFSVQVSACMSLFPDTRHLTPETLRFGAWSLEFLFLHQCSKTDSIHLPQQQPAAALTFVPTAE
ncbi:MAG: hypothetical protein C0610_08250, partial [Desulfobacteraceae bacterium]